MDTALCKEKKNPHGQRKKLRNLFQNRMR